MSKFIPLLILFLTWPEFFAALQKVECFSDPCTTENHKGRYQISYEYWKLSGTPGYWGMVENDVYAQKVMMNYWFKYNLEDIERGDLERLARTHNGGNNFGRTTDVYWERVQIVLSGHNWWNGEKL